MALPLRLLIGNMNPPTAWVNIVTGFIFDCYSKHFPEISGFCPA
jgi:hypothetical protein